MIGIEKQSVSSVPMPFNMRPSTDSKVTMIGKSNVVTASSVVVIHAVQGLLDRSVITNNSLICNIQQQNNRESKEIWNELDLFYL